MSGTDDAQSELRILMSTWRSSSPRSRATSAAARDSTCRTGGSAPPDGSRQDGQRGMSALHQIGHQIAQAVEALAHGQSLPSPEVDALEDRRNLVVGETEVPGQLRQ